MMVDVGTVLYVVVGMLCSVGAFIVTLNILDLFHTTTRSSSGILPREITPPFIGSFASDRGKYQQEPEQVPTDLISGKSTLGDGFNGRFDFREDNVVREVPPPSNDVTSVISLQQHPLISNDFYPDATRNPQTAQQRSL